MVKINIILIGEGLVATANGINHEPAEVEHLKKIQVFIKSLAKEIPGTQMRMFERTTKAGVDAGLEA